MNPGVPPEDLEHQEALVGTGRGAQLIGHGDRPGDAGAEPDAVLGAGHVVVHRLGDGDDLEALLEKADPIAQRVVAADRNQGVDAEEIEIRQHLLGQIIGLVGVAIAQMSRDLLPGHPRRVGARGVEKGAAETTHTLDQLLGQRHDAGAVVRLGVADEIDQTGPSPPDTDDLVALVTRPEGYPANRRIEPGYIAASGENPDNTLARSAGHDNPPSKARRESISAVG